MACPRIYVRAMKSRRKDVAEFYSMFHFGRFIACSISAFYSMFHFGEGIANGKLVAQTVDQSAQKGEKVD